MTNEISSPATSERFQILLRLESILMPYATKQRRDFYTGESAIKPAARFVHYTTAGAALQILRTKRLWMRNATCMADYREVQHGLEIVQRFLADPNRKKGFVETFNTALPNLADEALQLFNQWSANIRFDTY